MNSRTIILLFIGTILFGLFGLSNAAYCQNNQNQQQKGALLPNISPQDIEIQGKYQAHFPGLKRQPILGFKPNHEAFQINPNRTPFMGNGNQEGTSLPVSQLSRPTPPQFNALNTTNSISTFARLGYGSYKSPEARYWGAYPMNDSTSYVGIGVNLSSSAGHLDNRPSSFRFLNIRGAYDTKVNDNTTLKLHAGLQNDFNYPVVFKNSGLQNTFLPTPDSSASASLENFHIKNRGYHGGIVLRKFRNDISGWKLKADVRSFKTKFNSQPLGGSISEATYDGYFSNTWALDHPNETLSIKAGGRGGNYNPQNSGNQQWGTLQAGVAYKRLFNYQTHVDLAARIYYVSDKKQSKVYPGGYIKLDHSFGNRLKITGKVQGKPHLNTVEDLHNRNRFLGYDNSLVHTYTFDVIGKADIKYYRGSKLHFGATYTNYQNYAYFTPNTIPNPSSGPGLDEYTVNYKNATNFKLYAGLTQQLLPERFWFTGKIYVQHPQLSGGGKIPFQENWGLNASTTIRPIDRISIKGWANYTSKRHTGINNNTVGGYLLVGGQLDVNISDNIGVYGKVVNLLNQHYQVWQGYQERPIQIFGGITLKF